MQLGDVLLRSHEFLGSVLGLLISIGAADLCFCFGCLLCRYFPGIGSSLRRCIIHGVLVLSLGRLLLGLCLCHLHVKRLDQQVDHSDDTIAILRLLGVAIPRLRWRRRRIFPNLHQYGLLLSRLCKSVGDSLLLRHRRWRRRQIKLGIVELVQPVLGVLEQLFRHAVRADEFSVLLMLLLPQEGGIGHTLVKRGDATLQLFDLIRQDGDRLFSVLDDRGEVFQVLLELLDLVLGCVNLLLAHLLLVLIVNLLFLEHCEHVINHLHYLGEVHLASRQRHGDETKLWVLLAGVARQLLQACKRSAHLRLLAGTQLQKATAALTGQRFLEEV
mmetsp:Transcript_12235/g.28521  ORF Transcript_12235/g.28521 Transcript_12235/m.28521 type:complete len:329 (+) Transcript_12235:273-1259(+)